MEQSPQGRHTSWRSWPGPEGTPASRTQRQGSASHAQPTRTEACSGGDGVLETGRWRQFHNKAASSLMTLLWGGGVYIPSLSSGRLVEVILGDLGCQVPGGSSPLPLGWKSCSWRLQGPVEGLTAEATTRHRNPATRRDLGFQETWGVSAEPLPALSVCSRSPGSGAGRSPPPHQQGPEQSSQAPGFGVTSRSNCKRPGQAACAGEDTLIACTELKPGPRGGKRGHGDAPPAGLLGRGHCSCLEGRRGGVRGVGKEPPAKRGQEGAQVEPEDPTAGLEPHVSGHSWGLAVIESVGDTVRCPVSQQLQT